MSAIFLATEANEGMGHIAPWLNFVRMARQQGHVVHMAAPDLGLLEKLMSGSLGLNIWQSPNMRSNAKPGNANPKSWPELLLFLGYGNTDLLSGSVKAWVNILKAVAADVIIADYAPAVQLAAKVLGIPVIEAGGGFCVPPLSPPQCFPGVEWHDLAIVNNAADLLNKAFSTALYRTGCSYTSNNLADYASWPLRRIVLSPPELDHYRKRDVSYFGLLGLGSEQSQPTPIQSRTVTRPVKVVGYLKPNTPGLATLLDQLGDAGVDAHLYIPDSDSSTSCSNVVVVSDPMDFHKVLPAADIYLSNGGLNGVGLAMNYGCWPVIVPMQAEQVAMARNLVRSERGGVWMKDSSGGAPTLVSDSRRVFSVPRSRTLLPRPSNNGQAEISLLQLIEGLAGLSPEDSCRPAETKALPSVNSQAVLRRGGNAGYRNLVEGETM